MTLTRHQAPILRHTVDDEGSVSWLELFFDLIYVAALIQLGDALSADVSWAGFARFAGLFVVLWWTWTGTTAFMNRYAVDDVIHRALVFLQMFAVGNFAIVAVAPIDNRWAWLVPAYVAARIPLLTMYLRSRSLGAGAARLSSLYLTAFSTGIALWILSLVLPTPWRFGLWALALAVEFAAPIIGVRRTDTPPAHEEHFRERYALFTIIVLGESFVKNLTELAEVGVSVHTQVFGGLTFAISVALWWTYFDDVAGSSIGPGAGRLRDAGLVRVMWVYSHLPLAMGLTAFGVAGKKVVVVDAFDSSLKMSYLWLLAGSIALVFVAAAVLDALTVSPHFAVATRLQICLRIGAAGIILAVPLVLGSGSALLAVAVVVLAAVGQIAIEVVYADRTEQAVEQRVAGELASIEGSCPDLETMEYRRRSESHATCGICEEHGLMWVQLRTCQTCGYVGCCDDSDGRHARLHHAETNHPVIIDTDRGSTWAYCFEHDTVDAEWTLRRDRAQ